MLGALLMALGARLGVAALKSTGMLSGFSTLFFLLSDTVNFGLGPVKKSSNLAFLNCIPCSTAS